MSFLLFYFFLPIIYLISILPFRILYFLSDITRFFLFDIFKYRKDVILQNLKNSFPEKSDKEIKTISKKAQQSFCDLMFEIIKLLTISKKTLQQRVQIGDFTCFQKYYTAKQSVIVVMGHRCNWEWAGARFTMEGYHPLYVIYKPLKNKAMDKLVARMRTRFGNKIYERDASFRNMVRDKNKLTATAFIADQTPQPNNAYWLTFLNQDTPVFVGTEKIAKKLNYPVIFVSMQKIKRGYYQLEAEIICDKPSESVDGEITSLHTKRLEKDIINDPAPWFWTHKRWKHKRYNL